ncbi:homoprotocatechuate degradation operon regulator HpaR [Pararhodobacter aggregans]|uniref:Homoprotocatechuate degradation operon regulator HpaR n=1 Tax=Pararhodobacter aggregans TaxID=404875 RepID=A0A2T7UW72_9RHOB|nr:homoprotocatechuate degradation operon regulator HpaR [Pararhodobacter aggregans]PTX04657.1 MarR family transcriptional regulator [Pararhodobacter aggregans]PVE48997.1 homoprotocatechuate degradation operon regulator HpaR [Pararhodobacter aggregans]
MSKTPLRTTARSLPIALLRARETVMGPVREMLAESGINEQKWRVLRVLDEAGSLDQSLLAERACLQLPSLTRILRAMEDQGLVTRATAAEDRRRSIVTISEAGQQVIEDHAQANRALFARLEARFGKDRMEVLLDLLEDLHRTDFKS